VAVEKNYNWRLDSLAVAGIDYGLAGAWEPFQQLNVADEVYFELVGDVVC
jgi:hypothetical protein